MPSSIEISSQSDSDIEILNFTKNDKDQPGDGDEIMNHQVIIKIANKKVY